MSLSGILHDACIDFILGVMWIQRHWGLFARSVFGFSQNPKWNGKGDGNIVVIIFGSWSNSNPFQVWSQIKATSLCTWQEVKERIVAPYQGNAPTCGTLVGFTLQKHTFWIRQHLWNSEMFV